MANLGVVPSAVTVPIDAAIAAPAAGNTFTFQPKPGQTDFSALFAAYGTLTTLSADLQSQAPDGTWQNVATAILTAAAPRKIVTPLVANVPYRLNYTTASGSINTAVTPN